LIASLVVSTSSTSGKPDWIGALLLPQTGGNDYQPASASVNSQEQHAG
jgi:hypothetical protein